MADHFLKEHNPYFDPVLHEAHDFATHQLGLQVADKSQVAIIDEEHAADVRDRLGLTTAGNFDPKTGRAVVFAEGNAANPTGATTRLGSQVVHELVHSGTGSTTEHRFYIEALAGLGENKYLQWLEKQGRWKPPADLVLKRAGVQLWLPGNFRYGETYDTQKPANSSQGLVAGLGVGLGMHNSAIKVADVMTVSRFDGREQFAVMKRAVNSLKPGLAKEVETFPPSTDGIIQATAMIQDEARKQGLIR